MEVGRVRNVNWLNRVVLDAPRSIDGPCVDAVDLSQSARTAYSTSHRETILASGLAPLGIHAGDHPKDLKRVKNHRPCSVPMLRFKPRMGAKAVAQ